MTTITITESQVWKTELESMVAETENPEELAALKGLQAALSPFFDEPARFKTLLGKIQGKSIEFETETEITSKSYQNLDEVQEALPAGVTVSYL